MRMHCELGLDGGPCPTCVAYAAGHLAGSDSVAIERFIVRTQGDWGFFLVDFKLNMLSIVSGCGNYSYLWSCPGESFRRFLLNADPGYIAGKFLSGRPDAEIPDEEASKKAIYKLIARVWGYRGSDDAQKKKAKEERKLLRDSDFSREFGIKEWADQSDLPRCISDWYEYLATRQNPQAARLMRVLWPEFLNQLGRERCT